MDKQKTKPSMNRRNFLQSSAAVGAGLVMSPMALGAASGGDDLNIAILGCGAQGQVLMNAIIKGKLPGIRFKAICDIWTAYNQKRDPFQGDLRYLDGLQPEACLRHIAGLQARAQQVRGLQGNARQGKGPRCGDNRDSGLLAFSSCGGLHGGGLARLLREGDVEHAGRRQEDG